MLADKVYKGAEHVCSLVPTKIPQIHKKSDTINSLDLSVWFVKIIMAVFVWDVISKKWDHGIYDKVIGLHLPMHIDIQPLQVDEHKVYRSLLSEYTQLAQKQAEWKRSNEKVPGKDEKEK